MHKQKFILESEMLMILRDFETQTDHVIPARRLGLLLNYKREREWGDFSSRGFYGSSGPLKENKKK